jgi:hypothetical protein
MYAFPYQPEVVQKNSILHCSLFTEKCKKNKSEVRVPHRYLILPPVPPPFIKNFHEKRKDEFIHSLNPSSGLTGLEPAASALTGRCSNQLNYNPCGVYGMPILK